MATQNHNPKFRISTVTALEKLVANQDYKNNPPVSKGGRSVVCLQDF